MKAFMLYLLRGIAILLTAMVCLGRPQPTAPVFREVFSFTNSWVRAKAFNNAGDVLATYYDLVEGSPREVLGILRGEAKVRIGPVTDAMALSVAATGMSQRREDGHVFVAGTATCTDGFSRACIWDVGPDGTYVFTVAQIITLPPSSLLPGAKDNSYGVAVNKEGVMAGGGDSYYGSVPTRWAPPYNVAETFALSTYAGCDFVDIDDSGNLLANAVEFDHSGTNRHTAAAVVSADGVVTEIPRLDPGQLPPWWPIPLPGSDRFYNNEAVMRRGEWVVGRSVVSGTFYAFAWRIGTTNAIKLPGEYPTSARSVNARQQIFGNSGSGLTLWQHENGAFAPYPVANLIPADSFYPAEVNESFQNDAGEIALVFNDTSTIPRQTVLRIYAPVPDGIVQVVPYVQSAVETVAPLEFTVRLTRASGNNNPVTVNYRTVEGTAKAGINFVPVSGSLTWAPGDVADKKVKVTLIDNIESDVGKTISLELTGASGAQLSKYPSATGSMTEFSPYINPLDFIFVPQVWGMAKYIPAVQGADQILLRLERTQSTDGRVTIGNFNASDITAPNGGEYILPADVSATWEAGEGGIKLVSLPLPQAGIISTNWSFTLSAEVRAEGQSVNWERFSVLVMPPQSGVIPVFFPYRATAIVNGKYRMPVRAAQGMTVQLLNAPTAAGPWTVASEGLSVDGSLMFETSAKTEGFEFFQLRQKP